MKTCRKALILGAGLSGLSAAQLLCAEGADVTVLDTRQESELTQAHARLKDMGAHTRFGPGPFPQDDYDLCVVSPGIPASSEWVRTAFARCGEVIPEMELGWRHARVRTIAVTGSNGKSTAVKWCVESLQRAGRKSLAAGNYGVPVSTVALDKPELDWLVIEVSSFQLETVRAFRPDIGVLLNVYPNHLDRHGTWSAYLDAKARLFAHARESDTCLVPLNWLEECQTRSAGRGQWKTFGTEPEATYSARAGRVYRGDEALLDLSGTLFGQSGMADTACAVIGALDAAGIDVRYAAQAAETFEALPYRVQEIAVIDGVRYINDSKSTNLAAIAHALRGVQGPVRLIAGGLAKEKDFESLKRGLSECVKCVYLIGKSAEQMCSVWSRDVPCVICHTLDAALTRSRNDAQAGEAIVFSPGCASFDQFRNYEERGEHFTRRVIDLAGKGTS